MSDEAWREILLELFTAEPWYLYPCVKGNVYGCTALEHKCQGPDLTPKPLKP